MESSPLLRLPAELRNRIYALTLLDPEPLNLFSATPTLTQANRQLREETSLFYYSNNDFSLFYPTSHPETAEHLRLRIQTKETSQVSHMRSLKIQCGSFHWVTDFLQEDYTLRISSEECWKLSAILAGHRVDVERVKWTVVRPWQTRYSEYSGYSGSLVGWAGIEEAMEGLAKEALGLWREVAALGAVS